MAIDQNTVQALLYRLAQVVDPYTKTGQALNTFDSELGIVSVLNETPIKVNLETTTPLKTGDRVFIRNCPVTAINNTLQNPSWTITVIDQFQISLDGSSASGAGSGGGATPALIGSVDGERFTRQRLLDIYNQARFILFGVLRSALNTEELSRSVSGVIISKNDLSFTNGVATKPAGYLYPISLTDSSGAQIIILPSSYGPIVTSGSNPHFTESATNRFVFDEGNNLISVSGNTYIPNGSNYKLKYFGLNTFTLSDVFGGTVTETFNPDYHGVILEIAAAIAMELGQQEILSLAKTLIGEK